VESEKGSKERAEAYKRLEKPSKHYTFCGNIEPKELFTSDIDVLITDGFAGNIFLKTAEGVAAFAICQMQRKLGAVASLEKLRELLSDETSRGALIMGVDAVVVKCHGASSTKAIASAIKGTIELL